MINEYDSKFQALDEIRKSLENSIRIGIDLF